MTVTQSASRIAELRPELEQIAAHSGCELVHAELKGGVLRIFLDKPEGGVTLADCEHVAKLSSALPRRGRLRQGPVRPGGLLPRARPPALQAARLRAVRRQARAGGPGRSRDRARSGPWSDGCRSFSPSETAPERGLAGRGDGREERRADRSRFGRTFGWLGWRSSCRPEDREKKKPCLKHRRRKSTSTRSCARSRVRRISTWSGGSRRSRTRWRPRPRSSTGSRSRCAPISTARPASSTPSSSRRSSRRSRIRSPSGRSRRPATTRPTPRSGDEIHLPISTDGPRPHRRAVGQAGPLPARPRGRAREHLQRVHRPRGRGGQRHGQALRARRHHRRPRPHRGHRARAPSRRATSATARASASAP